MRDDARETRFRLSPHNLIPISLSAAPSQEYIIYHLDIRIYYYYYLHTHALHTAAVLCVPIFTMVFTVDGK